jgi:hypothetical protein
MSILDRLNSPSGRTWAMSLVYWGACFVHQAELFPLGRKWMYFVLIEIAMFAVFLALYRIADRKLINRWLADNIDYPFGMLVTGVLTIGAYFLLKVVQAIFLFIFLYYFGPQHIRL